MTGSRAPASVLAFTACLMLCAMIMRSAQAQDAGRGSRASAGTLHFDLPAQPLAQALQALARMTELVVLAPAPLLDGRFSAPIERDCLPREALQQILTGTGLRADFTGPDEALIVADRTSAAGSPASGADTASGGALPIDGLADGGAQLAYAATLQARLTDALCALPGARPGGYRLVAQLRIDGAGKVVAAEVVASTGLASRDAAIRRALRALRLDAAPPPGLPQPVTILLRPVGPGVHLDCPQADERG
ncbi:TonB C-terminal domain-containing protein [Burkholderia alba]|uniref:TonB C-terminal domain-containing protein n=1 Tax=Burkholderia alba TaxID=2683677 RepID=UPI002B05BCD2|nr:TonB C-terminal domain-containing protein [Burkholderia alba]